MKGDSIGCDYRMLFEELRRAWGGCQRMGESFGLTDFPLAPYGEPYCAVHRSVVVVL